MSNESRRACAIAVTLLLCLPAVMLAQSDQLTGTKTYANYGNYVTGTVQSVNRSLNYITVRDQSGREMKIDVRNMDTRQSINVWQLRPGDIVAANGGWENGDTFRASTVSFSTYRPMTTTSMDPNTLFGTVDRVNRNLKFITVRDQNSGQSVKVDVRKMDTRQSINVWQLRSGDPIVVTGGWKNRNGFRANRVNISSQPSMASASGTSNFVSGTVESVNRDLNYVSVRNDATGQLVKIDVRRMDTRRSVNAWQLRAGDRVAASGRWENGNTFQADTLNF